MSDPPIPDYPDSGLVRFFDQIEPPLTQGKYKFSANQTFPSSIEGKTTNMPAQSEEKYFVVEGSKYSIDKLKVHLRSPPKNEQQVIPGGTLPKIVFQSKTLPWERIVDNTDETKPWMTLLLITDDEFEQYCNKSSSTNPPHDILQISDAFLKSIGPCQDELSLLAHALQVNPMDKELCGDDEDGLFSVIVGNRVPTQESTKYHLCLVSVEDCLDKFTPTSDSVSYITKLVGIGNHDFADSNKDIISDMTAVYSGDLVDDIREHIGPPGFGEPDPPTQIDPPQTPPVEFEPPKDLEKHGAGPSQRRTRRFSSFDLLLAGADLDFASKHSIAEDSANKFAKISDITNTLASQINAPDGTFSGTPIDLILLDYWTFKTGDGGDFENKMKKLAVRRKESDSNNSGPNLTLYDLEAGTSSASEPSFYEPALLGNDMDPDVTVNSFIYTDVVEHDGITRPCLYRGPCIAVPTSHNPKSEPYVNSDDAKMLETDTGLDVIHHSAAFELGRLLALSSPSFVMSLTRWRRLNAHKKAVSTNLDQISIKYDLEISKDIDLSSIKSVLQGDALSKSSVIAESMVEEYKELSEMPDIPTPLPDDPYWDKEIPTDFEGIDLETTVDEVIDETIGEDLELGGDFDLE